MSMRISWGGAVGGGGGGGGHGEAGEDTIKVCKSVAQPKQTCHSPPPPNLNRLARSCSDICPSILFFLTGRI